MTPAELKYRNRQKVWVARTDLPEGNIITHEQMALKMTDQPGGISDQAMLLGRTLKKSVLCDSVLSEEVLKVES